MFVKRLAIACLVASFAFIGGGQAFADGVWMPGGWGLGDDWNPDSNDFTDLGGALFGNTLSGLNANQRYSFKIVEDANNDNIGNWDDDTVIPAGSNAVVYADGNGEIQVGFDSNTQRYAVSNFQTANPWFAVGTFQDEAGASNDWDNMAAETQMTDMGGGIYQYVTPFIAAGDYEWKATTNGWDFQVGDEGVNENGTTQTFSLDGSQYAIMTMDSNTQSITLQVVPEPGSLGLLALAGVVGLVRRKRS